MLLNEGWNGVLRVAAEEEKGNPERLQHRFF